MSDERQRTIPIWFFIGVLFVIYGVLIVGAGIYGMYDPPEVAMQELHLSLWWGALLLAIGTFYTIRFWPGRQ
ncbi:MAG: hypothetical protein ACUVUC_00785 [Thermoguttaceae bacterium]